jgi:hypothetical protein
MNIMAALSEARKRERTLLDNALNALARTTGLRATITAREPRLTNGVRPDTLIEIRVDGKRVPLFAEVKAVDRVVGLATVKNQLGKHAKRGVLITPYLTAELADHCRKNLDLQFIDTVGNAYLRAPGLYVFVKGERPPTREKPLGARGGGTATALRVVFALLCKPELLNAPYRDIVEAAGVALGAVGWVFFDLHGRGYIAGGLHKRNRQLLEPDRLLDEWVTNFPLKLRPKLNPRRFQAADPRWWEQAQLGAGAYWGGEVAAAKMTGHLKPATYTIYLRPDADQAMIPTLAKEHRLRADPKGNVEFLDAFWNFQMKVEDLNIVPPVLVYADLMATLDARNLNVAKQIRDEYIKRALRFA